MVLRKKHSSRTQTGENRTGKMERKPESLKAAPKHTHTHTRGVKANKNKPSDFLSPVKYKIAKKQISLAGYFRIPPQRNIKFPQK